MPTLEEITEETRKLTGIEAARARLKVSRSFLYRLPNGTPGVYVLGRSKRFCVEELQAWARKQAEERAGK
jgi:hypothetical protein